MRNIVHIGAGGERRSVSDTIYHYFEPRDDKSLNIISSKDNVNIYPYVVLDYNGMGTLNITNKVACSSLLEPNLQLIKNLEPTNWDRFSIHHTIDVEVKRLDNVLPSDLVIDELIIDTQGTELNVLKGAGELLHNTVEIVCEVEFVELYIGQPLFQDVSDYLESFGFKFKKYRRLVNWNQKSPVFGDAVFTKTN